MGRSILPDEEKKKAVQVYLPAKIIEKIGMSECKELSENAILREYRRVFKSKNKTDV